MILHNLNRRNKVQDLIFISAVLSLLTVRNQRPYFSSTGRNVQRCAIFTLNSIVKQLSFVFPHGDASKELVPPLNGSPQFDVRRTNVQIHIPGISMPHSKKYWRGGGFECALIYLFYGIRSQGEIFVLYREIRGEIRVSSLIVTGLTLPYTHSFRQIYLPVSRHLYCGNYKPANGFAC